MEILFRGKRVDNGEWVYGSLINMDEDNNKMFIFPPFNYASTHPCYQIVAFNMVAVIPNTVGQCTGLDDKNGTKIFEGDKLTIHQFMFDGNEYEQELDCVVVWCDDSSCFCVKDIKKHDILKHMGYENDEKNDEWIPLCMIYGLHEESFEVIGNIHELVRNSYKLKGEE